MTRQIILCLSLVLLAGFLAPVLAQDAPGAAPQSVEERRLRVTIEQEYARLHAREKAVEQREIALKSLQQEVDKRIAEMQTLREELNSLQAKKSEDEQKRAAELAKMYEKMDAPKAAKLLVGLNEGLAVQILGKMRSKYAGRILNNLDAETAARLSYVYENRSRN